MKQFYKIQLKLLTPLFYWSTISSGVVFTDEFIGDLALYYAVNRVVKQCDFSNSFFGKFQPNYEEILELDYWISVARPVYNSLFNRTDLLAHKTEFKAEVISSTPRLEKQSSKSPFKGYFRQQGISPNSTFEAIFYGEESQIPPAIRVGTHLHTLVEVSYEELTDDSIVLLNLYTWQKIFQRKVDLSLGTIEFKSPAYVLLETKLTSELKNEISEIHN